MKIIPVFALSVFLVFYSSRSFYAEAQSDKNGRIEAEELLRQAVELTDIRSSGNHAFRFTARVKLFDEKGQPREGAYDLFWKSPTDWQDKLRIGDFSQIRTAAAERLFVGRNTPVLPLEVFQALKLLEFPDLLRLSPEVNAQKLQERTRNGSRERTIQLARPGRSAWKTIAFESSSSIPTRVEYKNSHFGYQFEDYLAFNGHQFPRILTEFDSNKTLIEVQVQELTEATIDDSTFIPSPDSHSFRWCPHPEHATSLDPGKALSIPWTLRDGALRHPVAIYGVVGTDGKWHKLAIVKSAGKEADSFWMNEMLQERLSPARCGEVPIEQESVVENKLP